MTTTPRPARSFVRVPHRNDKRHAALLIGVLVVLPAFPSATPRIAGQQSSAPPAAQAPPTQAAPTQAPPAQAPQAPSAEPTTVPPGQVPPLTFETGVELVSVDVSVVDKEGRPVRGLTKDDFELEVDGAPRVLASSLFVEQSAKSGPEVTEQFSTNEGAAGGRLIMIAIDQGNIRQRSNTSFIRTAQRVLDDVGPGDRVALAIIPGGTVIDFTPHVASVRTALLRSTGTSPGQITGRAFIQVSVSEAMAYDAGNIAVLNEIVERECVGISRPTEALPNPTAQCRADIQMELQNLAAFVRGQTENSLTALRQLLLGLRKVKGPKTVILLTEGLYLDRTTRQVNWVTDVAAEARASIYAVVLDDNYADYDTSARKISPTTTEDRRLRQEGIDTLVGLARGSAQYVSAGAEGAFQRLSRELTGYYLLGFEPDASERDGKSHDIRVRVKRPGVELRARRSFTVGGPATTKATADEALAETLRDPLLNTDFRLRVATYSFPDPASGKVRLLMAAGLGLPSDDSPVTDVGFRLTDGEGKLVASRFEAASKRTDGDHRWNGTVTVDPGTYTLKVAAIDSDGRRASVEHRLTATLTSAGSLKLGDLMLSEVSTSNDGLRPEIEPRVTSAGIDGYLEVFSPEAGTVEKATAVLEIAGDPNGPTLVSAPLPLVASKNPGRRVGQAQAEVADLPPGNYVARAIVALGGKPVGRVVRAFTFAPSAEVRARSTGGASSLALLRLSFDRASVLHADVLERMLQPVVQNNASAVVSAAMANVSKGELTKLPETVRPGADETPAAALLRGIGLFARGDLEPAANEFRRAIRADSSMSVAAFYLGACYAAGGRDKEAVGAWQTTLAAEQADPAIYALTAEAYLRLQDWQSAIDVAQEAAIQWPEDRSVERQLIRAQALGGQRREAIEGVDGFLRGHPSDTELALLGMKLLYDAAADGRSIQAPRDDLARYDRYLAAYKTGKGPEAALAERWRQTVAARAEN